MAAEAPARLYNFIADCELNRTFTFMDFELSEAAPCAREEINNSRKVPILITNKVVDGINGPVFAKATGAASRAELIRLHPCNPR